MAIDCCHFPDFGRPFYLKMLKILFVSIVYAIHSCLGDWPNGESKFCVDSDFLEFPCSCEQQRVNCQEKIFRVRSLCLVVVVAVVVYVSHFSSI